MRLTSELEDEIEQASWSSAPKTESEQVASRSDE